MLLPEFQADTRMFAVYLSLFLLDIAAKVPLYFFTRSFSERTPKCNQATFAACWFLGTRLWVAGAAAADLQVLRNNHSGSPRVPGDPRQLPPLPISLNIFSLWALCVTKVSPGFGPGQRVLLVVCFCRVFVFFFAAFSSASKLVADVAKASFLKVRLPLPCLCPCSPSLCPLRCAAGSAYCGSVCVRPLHFRCRRLRGLRRYFCSRFVLSHSLRGAPCTLRLPAHRLSTHRLPAVRPLISLTLARARSNRLLAHLLVVRRRRHRLGKSR